MSITTTTTSSFSNTEEGRPLNQLMLQMAGMGTAHHVSALESITRADIGQRFAGARLAVFMDLPTLQGKQEILERQLMGLRLTRASSVNWQHVSELTPRASQLDCGKASASPRTSCSSCISCTLSGCGWLVLGTEALVPLSIAPRMLGCSGDTSASSPKSSGLSQVHDHLLQQGHFPEEGWPGEGHAQRPLRGEAVGMARSAKGLRGVGAPAASTQLMADHGAKLLVAKAHGHPEKVFQDHPDRLQVPVNARREEEVVNSEDTGGLDGEPPHKPQNWSRTDREKQDAGEEPPQEKEPEKQEQEPEKEERLGQGVGPT
uniref:Uncharacterized protein n=1 Tax=Myotis myotis TaxID=51298 RepID=A0A7J7V3X7_MYOMY|nr:hypothetical protein mMyoMyo1_008487 [Myotis myotis]